MILNRQMFGDKLKNSNTSRAKCMFKKGLSINRPDV